MLPPMAENAVDPAELQAEIARLREENERLKAGGPQRRSGGVRGVAVVLLIVLGAVLTVPGIAAPWLRAQLLNTDRYVETMQPIIDDPAVIDYVALRITDRIFEEVDVEALLAQNLPPKLTWAAGPITGQIESTANDLVVKALSSDEFDQLWNQVNEEAHASLVAFLTTGDTSTLSVNASNQLVLNLSPIVAEVKQKIADGGLTFVSSLPTVTQSLEVEIGDASVLVQARQAVRLLQLAGWLFPVLALGCFALAIGLSRNRRRAVTWSGIGLAGGALTLGILLAIGRSGYLNGMADAAVPIDASTATFDALVRFLRNSIRLTALVGLLVALFAVLSGPTPGATKLRRTVGGVLTGAGEKTGFDSGPVGRWLAAHRTGVMVGLLVLGAVIFVTVDGPTPKFVLALVVVGLLLLAAVQFLAAAAGPDVGETQVGAGEADVESTSTDPLAKADSRSP
jgi:hypothetical protein